MINELATTIYNFALQVANYLPLTLGIIAAIWIIQLINNILRSRLSHLGIYPRSIFGLIGIACAPFLHQNFAHVFFNSLPLFLLLNAVLLSGYHVFFVVTLFIIVAAGFAIWLFGRRAIHIGSSTVIMGYFGYLLANAYQNPTMASIFLVLIVLYYFAGLIFALIPGKKGVSWEGHIFGFLAGIAASVFLPQLLMYL